MLESYTEPHHISAQQGDMDGNGSIGRYVFLPGSMKRAENIAARFNDVKVLENERGHHVYLGTIDGQDQPIDVAAVSTGMGPSSVDIIVSELILIGAKRFLRVGTAGSLQHGSLRAPSSVIATGAVRDECVSSHYVPVEVPMLSSPEMVAALEEAAVNLGYADSVYTGLVHTKSTLFARELLQGPLHEEHEKYMALLSKLGVMASEMEASTLFAFNLLNWGKIVPISKRKSNKDRVLTGSICAIPFNDFFVGDDDTLTRAIDQTIEISIEGIRILFNNEL